MLDFAAESGKLVPVKQEEANAFERWRGKGRIPGALKVDEYLAEVRG